MLTQKRYHIFLIVFLGMIFGFGPFLTDMYLPAFPQLQSFFGTDSSMVQLSLSACMLGLAVGQVIWGPLSDKYGRRPVIIGSLLIFMISCIGCLFSPSIQFLIVMRLLQGIGGSGGLVLSRSVAADLYSGKDLVRIMAIIGAVNGIAPVTAPVVGGLLTDSIGWRGIFAALLAIGLALIICAKVFKESLPVERRSQKNLLDSLSVFGPLLRNKRYVFSILQYGFLHGMFFSYLSSSPFIVQEHYGLSATGYSILFAVNAATVGVASILSMKFKSPSKCTLVASGALLILSVLVSAVLISDGSMWLYEACTMLQVFCCGLCFASTPALAMDLERKNAGAAAALLGVCTYTFGTVITPLVSLGNILVSTSIIYTASMAVAFYFSVRMHRG